MMSNLFIVPTPIGNLKDITLRAIEVLGNVNIILAEDTRVTKKLLKHYDITTPLKSYHQHNEHYITEKIVNELKKNNVQYALVSDAGTPGISDPGFLLVRACLKEQIKVVCLPGPTAFIPALIHSGFTCDRFVFEGFLPHKKGRKKKLLQFLKETRTIVLYESPHRLIKLLQELEHILPLNRSVSVSREISKIYEETITGDPKELLHHFSHNRPKGELVVIIESDKNDKKS